MKKGENENEQKKGDKNKIGKEEGETTRVRWKRITYRTVVGDSGVSGNLKYSFPSLPSTPPLGRWG